MYRTVANIVIDINRNIEYFLMLSGCECCWLLWSRVSGEISLHQLGRSWRLAEEVSSQAGEAGGGQHVALQEPKIDQTSSYQGKLYTAVRTLSDTYLTKTYQTKTLFLILIFVCELNSECTVHVSRSQIMFYFFLFQNLTDGEESFSISEIMQALGEFELLNTRLSHEKYFQS